MALETSLWDSAELLETPEDIAAYIEAAFDDGDPSVVTHATGVVARAKGMSPLARECGLSREALCKTLTPDGDPKLSTFFSVLEALGMKLTAHAAVNGDRSHPASIFASRKPEPAPVPAPGHVEAPQR